MMVSYAFDTDAKQLKFDLHLKSVDSNKYVALGLSTGICFQRQYFYIMDLLLQSYNFEFSQLIKFLKYFF